MKTKFVIAGALFCSMLLWGCGVYTFTGSTLPSHLQTVDLPLFINQSMEPGVAETITEELNRQLLSGNLLRVVSENGDATLSGAVVRYVNDPYTYTAAQERQVDVNSYIVRVSVQVELFDNKKKKAIYQGTVVGEGIYDFQNETEEIGKRKAIEDVVQQILQQSVQSW